jgi:tetratricopeptide (TPR) repeat protein
LITIITVNLESRSYSLEELVLRLKEDPGDPLIVKLAEKFLESGSTENALLTTLNGLNSAPDNNIARLLLAKIFYQMKLKRFAIRELDEIIEVAPKSKEKLNKLKAAILGQELSSNDTSVTKGSDKERIIGETEFDLGDLEL